MDLIFPVTDDFRRIVEHAASAAEISPTWGQMADPRLQKPSAAGKDILQLTAADVDPAKLPRSLWLVKDSGCYIMSSGKPGLTAGDPAKPERQLAVHSAGGWDDQDQLEDEIGGDDFVETIPLDFVQAGLAQGHTRLIVGITETAVSLAMDSGG